jgi:hypothetical protein
VSEGFAYICGHLMSEVGQSFADGLVVCPIDQEPLAPHDPSNPVVQLETSLTLHLEGSSREVLDRWVRALEETLTRDAVVVAFDVTVGLPA